MKTPGLNSALRSCVRVTLEAAVAVAAAIAASAAFIYIAVTERNRWTS